MKNVLNFALVIFVVCYNLPIIILFALISVWHWDSKYVSDFASGIIEGSDVMQ